MLADGFRRWPRFQRGFLPGETPPIYIDHNKKLTEDHGPAHPLG
jgi:hypothetical protein